MKNFLFRIALISVLMTSVNAKSFVLKIVKNVGPLIIVELPIAESQTLFLLDTGSNATFIDPNSLKKFNGMLKRDKSLDKDVNTFSGKKKSEGYRLSFSLDTFAFDDLETYAMKTDKFKKKEDGIKCCDGILGMNFLKKYFLEVNVKEKKVTLLDSLKVDKSFKKLKIEIKGKDTIVVSCKIEDQKNLMRLDSGNEVPIVFQREGVRTLRIRESLHQAGYSGRGLPFFKLDELSCGKHSFKKVSATYFNTQIGALSHSAVTANMGSHILGDHYILDIENRQIYFKDQSKMISPSIKGLKHYAFKLQTDLNRSHPSVLDQTLFFILNSCAQGASNGECLNFLCLLQEQKCAYKKDVPLMTGFIDLYYKKKTPECRERQLLTELQSRPTEYNYCWYKLHELNKKKERTLTKLALPQRLRKIEQIKDLDVYQVTSLKGFLKDFYCFYVAHSVINPKALTPAYFPLSLKGGSYTKKEVDQFEKWSKTDTFKACSEVVYYDIGEAASKDLMKKDLIFVNPLTIMADGVKDFKGNLDRVLNHEALHILYARDESMRKKAKKMWNSLSKKKKEAFKKEHSSYDFSNLGTVYREYFSYYYESKLDDLF